MLRLESLSHGTPMPPLVVKMTGTNVSPRRLHRPLLASVLPFLTLFPSVSLTSPRASVHISRGWLIARAASSFGEWLFELGSTMLTVTSKAALAYECGLPPTCPSV